MADPITPRAVVPHPAALGRRRGPGRLLAVLALGGFFVAGVVLVVTGLSHRGSTSPEVSTVAKPALTHPPAVKPKPKPVHHVAAVPIHVAGVGAYDPPPGDGQEDDAQAPLATDGNMATFWHTEHYNTWYKPGVGLVLDAGKPVRPTALTLRTDTPGFVAEIEAGQSATGPFTPISASKTTTATTVYRLQPAAAVRYVVVWITKLDGSADVNEVTVR